MKVDDVGYFFFVVGLVVDFIVWIWVVDIEGYYINRLGVKNGIQ